MNISLIKLELITTRVLVDIKDNDETDIALLPHWKLKEQWGAVICNVIITNTLSIFTTVVLHSETNQARLQHRKHFSICLLLTVQVTWGKKKFKVKVSKHHKEVRSKLLTLRFLHFPLPGAGSSDAGGVTIKMCELACCLWSEVEMNGPRL